jgi:hypothetical protein
MSVRAPPCFFFFPPLTSAIVKKREGTQTAVLCEGPLLLLLECVCVLVSNECGSIILSTYWGDKGGKMEKEPLILLLGGGSSDFFLLCRNQGEKLCGYIYI